MTSSTLTKQIDIAAGRLDLSLTEGAERLDELLTFASRLNPRRGYLFVSRVLGKHVPVLPSKMDAIHAELAESICLAGKIPYVVGMAETAIGLGAGVARHLGRHYQIAVYQHTTRFLVPKPWLRIREAHSHADTMHIAHLNHESAVLAAESRDLVLVDDEISTGKTLAQLARELLNTELLAHVTHLHIVSLVSWLTDEARAALLAELPSHVEVHFVQLMAGTFTFTPDPDYRAELPEHVDTDFCATLVAVGRPTAPLPIEQDGLFGKVLGLEDEPWPAGNRECQTLYSELYRDPEITGPLAVYGMGEYLDAPFRFALALESLGHDVRFQSSTRSPIAVGDDIAAKLDMPALGQSGRAGKRHFLYNPDAKRHPLAFSGTGEPAMHAALTSAHWAYSRTISAKVEEDA